jgi:predicted Zn-dependent protease
MLACTLPVGPVHGHPELLAQIRLLDAQLTEQPDNTDLLLQRGDLYRRHGDYSAAERDFAAARTLDSANDKLDFYAGRLRLETGDAAQAEATLSRYLERHAEHAAAWSLRGQARLALGQPAKAADDFGSAIARAVHPTPTLYLERCVALFAAGQRHWESARAAADAGLANHPQDVALLGMAADISLALGESSLAAAYLDLLPVALRGLHQWHSRAESLNCLAARASDPEECVAPALERLERQVRAQSKAVTMDAR